MACGAANSPLMGLPGEVRNRIYRYAVVEPEGSTIDIRTTRLQEPGLLTTCKDIRAEAGSLYFAENTFKLFLWNCCCAASCFWTSKRTRVVKEFGIQFEDIPTRIAPNIFRAPSWQNLLKWMRHYHEKRSETSLHSPMGLKEKGNRSLALNHIGRMFCTVDAMRDKAWTEVEKLLVQDQVILGIVNPAWTA